MNELTAFIMIEFMKLQVNAVAVGGLLFISYKFYKLFKTFIPELLREQ